VLALFEEPANRIISSRLAVLEIDSAFARLVREGVTTKADFEELTATLGKDIGEGRIQILAVSAVTFATASTIIRSIGLEQSLRSLDALHAATAQKVHQRSKLAAFVVADKRLLSSAEACGLPVLDVS
jgi:predicted nucleic acid-binding protein